MDALTKEKLIRMSMDEAKKAILEGNLPFGAILSDSEGNVIGVAHNTSNIDIDPTAHAEINLIRKITKKLGTKDLSDYYLISNAQSCSMCFSAAIKSKIKNFIFGADSEQGMNPALNVFEISKYSKDKLNITTGILKDECKNQIEQTRKMMK